MVSKQIRTTAWEALRGKWGICIAVSFVAGLLTTSITIPTDNADFQLLLDYLPDFLSRSTTMLLLTLISTWSLVTWLIAGPVTLGIGRFFLKVSDRKSLHFSELFSGFSYFGKSFAANFLYSLVITLLTMLLIIPGIIASFSYAMWPYIMAEHPEYGSVQVLRASRELMRGNKFRLFKLELSFLGWIFITLITLGIAGFWVSPYMNTSFAVFYRDISGTWETVSQEQETYRRQGPEF